MVEYQTELARNKERPTASAHSDWCTALVVYIINPHVHSHHQTPSRLNLGNWKVMRGLFSFLNTISILSSPSTIHYRVHP